ncbi:hybrid sensor histidine kinase/response regulator transcription factor [Mucilaginibacter arboris]|uniref:histidine kinase n=1 Tax=Mucilaginibacter arboris TaxID=2682090 RepID=A0A7K1SW21_9SPHI|nr:two-component regulator propeller domain-containing protein [Mucilaginibacter arboris]MVN21437.1 response regulator [Mucilaginibacter arboris]
MLNTVRTAQLINALQRIFISLITFLALAIYPAHAQKLNLKFKHLTSTQGLSNNTVETIYQDKRGFLWFGTRDGLNKYDGNKIRVFKNNVRDPTSISDNYINCIAEDLRGNLWIGTINGLNKFNPYTNTFTRYKHSPFNNNTVSANDITCIYSDKNSNLWIGTESGGLNLFDAKHTVFKHFHHQKNRIESLPSQQVNCLFEDSKQRFWIGTDKGLSLFNRNTGSFSSTFDLNGNPSTQINYAILKIQEDKNGNIWLGTFNDGLITFNLNTHNYQQFRHSNSDIFSLSTNQIRSLLADQKGNIWAGGINGSLDLYKPESNNFEHSQNELGNPLSLSQKTLSAIFKDNQNNLWVGTHRGGINFYAPLADKFQLYQQQPNANSLSYNDVKAFYEDDKNRIWIGTDGGGLNLFNASNHTFQHFRYNVYGPESISSDAVLSINEDRYKNFWIGTWGGGLNLMNRDKYTFTHYVNNPNDKNSISSNFVQSTLQDSEGNFWIATYYGGLNLFNYKTHQFKRISSDFEQKTSLYGNNIITLNEDKDKNLWIGTDDGGLNCYNLIKKKFSHYFLNSERTPDIRVIFTDSKGRVWVGQTGLFLFDKRSNRFNLFTEEAGLSSEFIKGITEDETGNLWISSSNGLTKLNPENKSFKKYNVADGLQELEFEAGAYMKTGNGEMYFGGINGFNKFYPKDIKRNQQVATVYLTNFQLFNQTVIPGQKDAPLQQDISLTHQISLNYKQNTLSFEFATLNYTAPENNNYTYKLEGFDQSWHNPTTETKASYTNLNPGHYKFYVKAANNDGVWNPDIAYINIDILPPFWATWWFRSLIILSGLTVVYFSLRFKKNLDLQKIEENKRDEIHQMQLLFFTNISHEFRTPLSLILGPLEKIREEDTKQIFKQHYETIHRNANRLLLLINELMDFRKAESGALKLGVVQGNLDLFISEITYDFKDLSLQKQIDFQIIIRHNFAEAWFDRQILEKIILNLIDNAFKYTPVGGKITVELYADAVNFNSSHPNKIIINNNYRPQKAAFIRVSDNGIGISKDSVNHLFERYYRITDAHLGSGVGLAFVKSLTLIHKGSLSVFSEREKGSDFIICVPVDQSDYLAQERWVPNSAIISTRLESITAPYHQSDYHDLPEQENLFTGISNHSVKQKILIVEDNHELRAFLKNTLREFYEVIEAADGLKGLSKAKEYLPDLIISDVMMPGINGIDLCKKIKSEFYTSHIPFIILSAKDAIESKIEGASSGADLFFPKPVSINLLLISINNILEQRKVLQESYLKKYFNQTAEAADVNKDKIFLEQFNQLIEQELSNADLDVEHICREMGMSKTKLYHIVKKVSGQSIGEYVRTFRLKKAAYIIAHEDVLLNDVMYRVGIQTQSYFTKAFKKEFGKTPSQFLNDLQADKS